MVSPAIVRARYRTAFDDHLDDDEPEDSVDALRNQEFAYWDKVDDAFQRFVKRSVTPLIKNPALPADLGAELALVFEKGQGDDATFNMLWVKLPHAKEGCGQIVIDTDGEWYADERKKRLRTVKVGLTGMDLRSAAGRGRAASGDRPRNPASRPELLGVAEREPEDGHDSRGRGSGGPANSHRQARLIGGLPGARRGRTKPKFRDSNVAVLSVVPGSGTRRCISPRSSFEPRVAVYEGVAP